MIRRNTLDKLIELRQQALQGSMLTLANKRQKTMQSLQQYQNLLRYFQEYQQQFSELQQQGISAFQLTNYQQFIHALDMAMAQQQSVLSECREQEQQAYLCWQEKQKGLKVFETLRARQETQGLLHSNRVEQRQQDEVAQQVIGRRKQQWF